MGIFRIGCAPGVQNADIDRDRLATRESETVCVMHHDVLFSGSDKLQVKVQGICHAICLGIAGIEPR